jgi:hypothetical protein
MEIRALIAIGASNATRLRDMKRTASHNNWRKIRL